MKVCTKCGEEKPLEEFHVDRRGKDGRQAQCKPCKLAAGRTSYRKHREKKLAYQRQYRAENPEKRAATLGDWERRNPENYKERKRRYRKRHPEKIKAENAAYYRANRERILAQKTKYREQNREAIYARRDREKHAEGVRRRRARKLDAYVAPVSDSAIIQRDRGRCGICGKPIMGDLEIDHIVPLAKGGTHEPDNVQLAHRRCNRKKHIQVSAPGAEAPETLTAAG